jgi:hypothetical protein
MKNFLKTILILILIVFVTLVLIPVCLKFVAEMPIENELFRVITPQTYEAWIGYCGSMVGGALTLIGVWWTIKYESAQIKEKLDLEKMTKYFPTISARILKSSLVNDLCSSVNFEIHSNFFKATTKDYGDCLIALANVGQTEVYIDGIVLDFFKLNYVNPQLDIDDEKITHFFVGDGNFKFLPVGEKFYLKLGYTKLDSIIDTHFEITRDTVLFSMMYSFVIDVGGVLTGDDPFQYFLTLDIDVHYNGENYIYKIYNLSLVR